MTERKPVTTASLAAMKARGEAITMLTAYDATMARLLDQAGVDVILVGDSAANVVAGFETTLPITLEHMLYHAASVVRGADFPLVIVDLPFGSYQGSPRQALDSSIRIMKETGAHGVKLEGGRGVIEAVDKIVGAGIPVMGHLGLTPQSIYQFGSYKVRAKEEEEAQRLLQDARALEDAGCFALVLEKIPASLAAEVSKILRIPVIGIGAGREVDGQVLVLHDVLGLSEEFQPRFVRRYAELAESVRTAVRDYCDDVKQRRFPSDENSY